MDNIRPRFSTNILQRKFMLHLKVTFDQQLSLINYNAQYKVNKKNHLNTPVIFRPTRIVTCTHYKSSIGLCRIEYRIKQGAKEKIKCHCKMLDHNINQQSKLAFLFRITAETAGVDKIPSLCHQNFTIFNTLQTLKLLLSRY